MVNVSSILGHRGIPFMPSICASKFAVQGFSESIRAEFAPHKIDVLVVSPGTTESEFSENVIERTERPAWSGRAGCRRRKWPGKQSGNLPGPARNHSEPAGPAPLLGQPSGPARSTG